MRLTVSFALALMLCASVPAFGQAPQRRVTTSQALASTSHFFHGSVVRFLGTVQDTTGFSVVPLGERQRMVVLWAEQQRPAGEVLLRGTFLDLGRLEPGDSRLSAVDMQRLLDTLHEGRWPGRNALFLLVDARAEEYEPPTQPDVRAIALNPAQYAGREVTLSGRFRGRNLFGDQPSSPGKSPNEYVLQVADASIWVSGLRPRGRGFTLDPDSRRDTREWVRVTGTVRHEPPMAWIEGKAIDITNPQDEATTPEPVSVTVPLGPAPEIVFSAPLDGETDVATDIVLRVQFSRDIDPESLRGQVAVAYGVNPDGSTPGTAPAASTSYRAGNRSIEVRFASPLAPYSTVIVAFGNGITATDGVAMKPSRISFTTGR